MVEEARQWWQDLPAVEKWVRALVGLVLLVAGGVLGFSRAHEVPRRVDLIEVRVDTLEARLIRRDADGALILNRLDALIRFRCLEIPADQRRLHSLCDGVRE